MSDVFIVDLFYFKIKILPYFVASNQHFIGMLQNIKHMIVNTVQVFNIRNTNNWQHLSIFYNISIFSFQSLCVSNLKYIPYLFSSL